MSVIDEYIYNDGDDVIVYERDGEDPKRLTVSPNMTLTRLCTLDTNDYLVGKLESGVEEEMDYKIKARYEACLEELRMGYCNWVEVLAVGKRRDWSKAEQRKYKIARRWTIQARIGDFMLMPERDKLALTHCSPYLHKRL